MASLRKKIDKASDETRSTNSNTVGPHVNLDVWHGLLPNEDTALLLRDDGDFLLRANEKENGAIRIVLSIRWGKEILNAVIIESGKGYEFQSKSFESIKDIIDLYQIRKRPLIISNITTTLEKPVRRKKWELRHHMVTLGKELGSGSFGTVYKGTLQLSNQEPLIQVAVKVLTEMSAGASAEMWKEARNHRMLNHPNVVKMYGIANDFLPYYLVMEWVKGGSVDQYIEKKGSKLKTAERVQMLIEAATGLDYLHSQGLLHRDIACRNLLIDKVVKVADFGRSRKSDNYKIDTNKPMNLRWLAPEVYETAVVNKATDIYAFGVTMFECFTCPYAIPYEGWSPNKVYEKVVTQGYRLEPPKLMPRQIAELMAECLGPENDRPTFKAIIIGLKNYFRDKKARNRS